jgi:hypothetical protein
MQNANLKMILHKKLSYNTASVVGNLTGRNKHQKVMIKTNERHQQRRMVNRIPTGMQRFWSNLLILF